MDRNNERLLDQSPPEELEAPVELSEQLSLVRGEALQDSGQAALLNAEVSANVRSVPFGPLAKLGLRHPLSLPHRSTFALLQIVS
jgi:hypothetical protein